MSHKTKIILEEKQMELTDFFDFEMWWEEIDDPDLQETDDRNKLLKYFENSYLIFTNIKSPDDLLELRQSLGREIVEAPWDNEDVLFRMFDDDKALLYESEVSDVIVGMDRAREYELLTDEGDEKQTWL